MSKERLNWFIYIKVCSLVSEIYLAPKFNCIGSHVIDPVLVAIFDNVGFHRLGNLNIL
jgi:hypothetical protein